MDAVQINVEDYALPVVSAPIKKTKETPKRQREPQEDPETKRMKMGGPPALPTHWRNKLPSEMVMSFTRPEVVLDIHWLSFKPHHSWRPLEDIVFQCQVIFEKIVFRTILWDMSICGHQLRTHIGNHATRRESCSKVWPPVI